MRRSTNRSRRASNATPNAVAPLKTTSTLDVWIAILLVIGIGVVYAQVIDHEFLNYDDPLYVTGNPHVRNGLTVEDILWAFTSAHDANWIPLTWLSHMLDCQLFGVSSGPQHLTNVVLHAVNALLLFVLLKRLTGARWPSAFVAFVFALHPLHVESVAWVAERKDVLCALFFFLSVGAYVKYVERPTVWRYGGVALLFCCGLMAKPMAVTLPLVLLLLDFWPLCRPAAVLRLIVEKLPLFALTAADSVIAFLAQRGAGAVAHLQHIPFGLRVENALVSYAAYIGAFIWPANLAVFYPYPPSISVWQWIGSALLLGACTFLVVRVWPRWPYLAIGWLWFVLTLLPVIGLVQVGSQSRADRYTYIPLVGIAIMLAWGAPRLFQGNRRKALPIMAIAACIAWAVTTWWNVQYWRDTVPLFQHAVEITRDNFVAYTNIADALRSSGRAEQAIPWFENAYRVRANDEQVLYNLGAALQVAGRNSEAISILARAIGLHPDSYRLHVALGNSLIRNGDADQAAAEFRLALRLRPEGAEAQYGLGGVLMSQGRSDEGRPHLEAGLSFLLEQVRARPQDPDSHYNLGTLYGFLGRKDDAIQELRDAVRLLPADGHARFNLGVALASAGRNAEAADEFAQAVQLLPNDPNPGLLWARTLLQLGRGEEARREYERLLEMDPHLEEGRRAIEQMRRRRSR